jgi:DNA-binding transcriptional regulator YhcF (GntR family)
MAAPGNVDIKLEVKRLQNYEIFNDNGWFEMEQRKSEIETKSLDAQKKAQAETRKITDDATERANQAFIETKRQADIVYEEAKKLPVDKQAKKEVDQAHKQAIEQAKKVRDAIVAEVWAAHTAAWEKGVKDHTDTMAKAQIDIKDADKAYKEAKKQADIVHKESKKTAVDKQAKKEADETHKKAIEQAKKVRDENTRGLR